MVFSQRMTPMFIDRLSPKGRHRHTHVVIANMPMGSHSHSNFLRSLLHRHAFFDAANVANSERASSTYFGQTPRNIQSRYQRQENIMRDFYATIIMISEIGSFFWIPFLEYLTCSKRQPKNKHHHHEVCSVQESECGLSTV